MNIKYKIKNKKYKILYKFKITKIFLNLIKLDKN